MNLLDKYELNNIDKYYIMGYGELGKYLQKFLSNKLSAKFYMECR